MVAAASGACVLAGLVAAGATTGSAAGGVAVWAITVAGAEKTFLPALAETCRAFREPQALRRLRAAATPEEFIETLQRHHEPAPDTGERP